MSKIIAVCGSPVSGKTTAGLKIAQELYYATNTPVIFIAPDVNTPALSYLFPRSKDKDLYSLGVALDKTSIIKEDILRQIVNPDSMNNFGLLGFKTGENRYTYPTPTEDKVRELFRACAEIAPIIFIDEEYKTISGEYAVTPYSVYSTPDTQYEKYAPSGFTVPDVPENSSAYARWWEYEYDNGNFIKKDYGLGIDVTDTERVYSESNDSFIYTFLIKSGYPFSTYFINSISQVSGYEFPNANAYTDVQYINAKFPEFGYRSGDGYSRTLFKDDYDQWQFRNNGNYGSVHFIPLYYPDGDYYVSFEKSDLWTPAGMIKGEMLSNPLVIEGNAYNDWYIGR